MQFVQTAQKNKPKQTKLTDVFTCLSKGLSFIISETRWTHTSKETKQKPKRKNKQTVWSKKVYKNKNQLAMTSKAQQIQGWCLLSFFYRREFDQALGKVRDPLPLFWISMYRYLHSIKQRRRSQRWGPGSLGPSCLGADKVCLADWVGWSSAGMEWESGCPWV